MFLPDVTAMFNSIITQVGQLQCSLVQHSLTSLPAQLPITQCTEHKMAIMSFSCIHDMSPNYFHGICRPVTSVKGCAIRRSAINYRELTEPRAKGKCYGLLSLWVAETTAQNDLPKHLQCTLMTIVMDNLFPN